MKEKSLIIYVFLVSIIIFTTSYIGCDKNIHKIQIPKEFTGREIIFLNDKFTDLISKCKSCENRTEWYDDQRMRLNLVYNNKFINDSIEVFLQFQESLLASYNIEFFNLQSKQSIDSLILLLNEKYINVNTQEKVKIKYNNKYYRKEWISDKFVTELIYVEYNGEKNGYGLRINFLTRKEWDRFNIK